MTRPDPTEAAIELGKILGGRGVFDELLRWHARNSPPPISGIKCPHCGVERPIPRGFLTDWDIQLYIAHLVETHFEALELAREQAGSVGRAGHTAWTRL